MTDKPKPPGDFTLQQFEALKPLAKLIGFFNPDMRKQFQDLDAQVESVKVMLANRDRFAEIYSPLGWVNYDRMSVDAVAKALAAEVDEGEAILTAYHLDPDNLRFLGYRFHTSHYASWGELYERAVERTAVEDYLSAIPLILIVIDGICTTTIAKHPFSGGADAPVFDSQTSGPGGLSEGLALFGSTRRKLDSSSITLPFRHGIVHGLNPNFGHSLVAAKAFNLLQAMVDYFDRRRDEAQRLAKAAEEQRPVDWKELGHSLLKNADTKKRLDAWEARPTIANTIITSSMSAGNLEEGSPEKAAVVYIENLVKRNFGALAQSTIDYPKRTIGFRAGRLRDELKDIIIVDWALTGVEDTAPAMTNVMVNMSGTLFGENWNGSQRHAADVCRRR
ncbi:MAG: hypothetical protein E5Y67_25335 [Mesorhizobium sp.]|uniref:hypothetical protein n=1 Tax=Mesorhizobium sp. TaxID=1871066 RepID=UPI001218A05B|nr:hypothetical protein [Mesorhizobium sp.]TIM10968.1 MAG: hypothetical protein E5Y67_25335 [Mesorhizobium sp.]